MKGSSINNCTNKVNILITVKAGVAGISGINCGKITNCQNFGNIFGTTRVGGISGEQTIDATGTYTYLIKDSYNYGEVKGEYYVGGIAGRTEIGNISKCKNNGLVQSTKYDESISGKTWSKTGGIVGYSKDAEIVECCNLEKGIVDSKYGCVGGIVGHSEQNIILCYNLGAVLGGTTNVGGIVGNLWNKTLNYSYNLGAIDSKGGYIGGVVGQIKGATMKNSYNGGTVSIKANSNFGNSSNGYNGYILGFNNGGTASTNVLNIEESTIKSWSSTDISNKLGLSFKKGSNYPILSWE